MGHFQPVNFRQNPSTVLPFGIYPLLYHHHVMPLFQSLGLLVHYQLLWNVTLFPSFLLVNMISLLYTVLTGPRQGRVQKKGEFTMGHLPIPASMLFSDFSFDVLEYNIIDNKNIVATYRGLSDSDEDGNYIGFIASEQPQISVGNTISTIDGIESFKVIKIAYDRYNGKPELLKAYY